MKMIRLALALFLSTFLLAGCKGPNQTVGSTSGPRQWLVGYGSPWGALTEPSTTIFQGQIWVYGGFQNGAVSNQIWSSMDAYNWALSGFTPWGNRAGAQLLEHNGELIFMGGRDELNNPFNDVWGSLDGINWYLKTPAATWSPRETFAAVSFQGGLYVFGGSIAPLRTPIADGWVSWDGGISWNALPAMPWAARFAHKVAVYNNQIWMSGGDSGAGPIQEIWSFDGVNWSFATPPWAARGFHEMVVLDNRLCVFGGRDTWSMITHNDMYCTQNPLTKWRVYPGYLSLDHGSSVILNNELYTIGGTDIWGGNGFVVWKFTHQMYF